jgi:hypothetical protein
MTHDERRDQLLQNRAGLREKALTNLGVAGHSDPFKADVNPFAAERARAAGLNAVVNPFSQLPGMMKQHGESMAQGVSAGVAKGTPAAQNQMAQFARGMQNVHKKTHGIQSPSTVFAGDGAAMPAGVAVGIAGNVGVAVAAVAGMSAAMQGPANDQGLQIGYRYADNIVTGVRTTLKTANLQASGTPTIANEQARTALGQRGLLGPGAGASVYKTPAVSFDGGGIAAAVAKAVQVAIQSQPTQVTVNLDGHFIAQKIASGQDALVEVLREALMGANG